MATIGLPQRNQTSQQLAHFTYAPPSRNEDHVALMVTLACMVLAALAWLIVANASKEGTLINPLADIAAQQYSAEPTGVNNGIPLNYSHGDMPVLPVLSSSNARPMQ